MPELTIEEFQRLPGFDADCFYVLYVEDHPEMYRPYLARILEEELDQRHDMAPERIVWLTARDRATALELIRLADAKRPAERGFDAVFCDLRIPAAAGATTESDENGLEVARVAASKRWAAPVIGLTQYAQEEAVLQRKVELDGLDGSEHNEPVFTEFLAKDQFENDPALARAKLQRCLVPVARYVEWAKTGDDPVFFAGRRMWRLCRQLALLAQQPAVKGALSRVLLVGAPGSGKTALARFFDRLLRRRDIDRKRPPLVHINCATLVADGEGGKVRLFGAGRGSTNIPAGPGVFEEATSYDPARADSGLAQSGAAIDYSRAGVVFLDEFVELPEAIQPAILNALEEGSIRRQVGNAIVDIGCHVVFATNGSLDSVRADLIDRIPNVLVVPSLATRADEDPAGLALLLCQMAVHRLRRFDPRYNLGIEITPSAGRTLATAIRLGWINSVRQLRTIAAVLPGERIISDSNLEWVIQKALRLGFSREAVQGETEDAGLPARIAALRLPESLSQQDLPEETIAVIGELYRVAVGSSPRRKPKDFYYNNLKEADQSARFWFLLGMVGDNGLKERLAPMERGEQGVEGNIRQRISQASKRLRSLGVPLPEPCQKQDRVRYLLAKPGAKPHPGVEASTPSS